MKRADLTEERKFIPGGEVKLIPVGEKKFAYQCENVSTVCVIKGSIPWRGGKEPYLNDEQDEVSHYELKIERFTGNSLTVTLTKFRSDIRRQREETGCAVTKEEYIFGTNFAHLVNQIFRGVNAEVYKTTETFPDEVKLAMKAAYKNQKGSIFRNQNYDLGDRIVLYGSAKGLNLSIDDEVTGEIVCVKEKLSRNRRKIHIYYDVRLDDGREMEFWDGQIKRKL